MQTIRLPDPFPRGAEKKKLEWGTSAWAQDSCLVEWSRLEREWLGEPPKEGAAAPKPRRGAPRLALGVRRAIAAVLFIALVAAVAALGWAWLG